MCPVQHSCLTTAGMVLLSCLSAGSRWHQGPSPGFQENPAQVWGSSLRYSWKSRRRDLQMHHQRAEHNRRNSSQQLMSPPPAAGEKPPEGLVAVLPNFVSLWLGPGSWSSLYDYRHSACSGPSPQPCPGRCPDISQPPLA